MYMYIYVKYVTFYYFYVKELCVCVCGLLNAISVCGLKYFIYLHIISQLLYCLSFIFIVNSLKEIELNFYH